jgi:hypothetical protein
MMCGPQLESGETINPLSSDVFDTLLRRAALKSRLISAQSAYPGSGETSPELAPIGEAAGTVWHLLYHDGPSTFATLMEITEMPPSLLFMAVGWLAREDKIGIKPRNGDYEVCLR